MNRLPLAQHLYTTPNTSLGAPAEWREWSDLDDGPKTAWLAVADAALSAMKGPRTGEELCRDLHSAALRRGNQFQSWEDLDEMGRAAFDWVAATFSAPPEPVGWPEGVGLPAPPWKVSNGTWQCGIFNAAGDYMRRWIFQTPWFTVHLHNIRRADRGEVLHDHPWNFISLILSGGYIEEGPEQADGDTPEAVRLPGDIARHHATDAHRITRVWPHTWTLVFTGPKIRRWGYHTSSGWVYYREHHAAVR